MNPNSQNPQRQSHEKEGPNVRASGDQNRPGNFDGQKQGEKKSHEQDKHTSPRREDDANEKNAPGRSNQQGR